MRKRPFGPGTLTPKSCPELTSPIFTSDTLAPHKTLAAIPLILVLGAFDAEAQFGARKNEVVIFALTSKGPQNFTIRAPNTVNPPQPATGVRYEVIEVEKLPNE